MKHNFKYGLIALTMFPTTALAQGEWYAGFNAGASLSAFSADNIFFNPALCTTDATYTCSSIPLGGFVEAYAGRQLTPVFGLEAGVSYLGNTTSAAYSQPLSSGTLKQSSVAVTLNAIARFDVGSENITPFAKAGGAYWASTIVYDRTPDSAIYTDRTVTENGFSPMVGIGAEFKTSANTTLRAGVNHYFGMGTATSPFDVGNVTITTANANVTVVYVGAVLEF